MRRLTALLFPGFEPLDLYGPLEMFGLMPEAFAIATAATSAGRVAASRGVSGWADGPLPGTSETDLLLVPGGPGVPDAMADARLTDWIAAKAAAAELTMSVCTGSLLLERSGVLDGRRATSNKASFNWVVDHAPDISWVPQARWVEDGPVVTSSGVSAGMDMALAVIARLHGRPAAERVARIAEYEWHDDPDRDLFAAVHGVGT